MNVKRGFPIPNKITFFFQFRSVILSFIIATPVTMYIWNWTEIWNFFSVLKGCSEKLNLKLSTKIVYVLSRYLEKVVNCVFCYILVPLNARLKLGTFFSTFYALLFLIWTRISSIYLCFRDIEQEKKNESFETVFLLFVGLVLICM